MASLVGVHKDEIANEDRRIRACRKLVADPLMDRIDTVAWAEVEWPPSRRAFCVRTRPGIA